MLIEFQLFFYRLLRKETPLPMVLYFPTSLELEEEEATIIMA